MSGQGASIGSFWVSGSPSPLESMPDCFYWYSKPVAFEHLHHDRHWNENKMTFPPDEPSMVQCTVPGNLDVRTQRIMVVGWSWTKPMELRVVLETPNPWFQVLASPRRRANYNLSCAICNIPVDKLGDIYKIGVALPTPWTHVIGNIVFYLEYLNSHKSMNDVILDSCTWSIWSSKELTFTLYFSWAFTIKSQATVVGQVKILLQAKSKHTSWCKPWSSSRLPYGQPTLLSWHWIVPFHRKKPYMPFRELNILLNCAQDTSTTRTRSEPMPLLLSQQVSVPKRPLNIADQGSEISGSIAMFSSEEVGMHHGPEITRVTIMSRWQPHIPLIQSQPW